MTHAPDDQRAAELRGIIADAEALEPLSRTRPDAFLEGKDALVRRLLDFYDDLRGAPTSPGTRLPERSTAFQCGHLVRRGRVIPVETRGRRCP